MIDKQRAYAALVKKRKAFRFVELLNPAEIEGGRFDSDHVELWARWQGNLDAKIMLVGKDFGGKDFFVRFKGGCDPNSVTNLNLMKLFSCLNINIGTPLMPEKNAPIFLTNAIVGIVDSDKKGGNRISSLSMRESTREFLRPLIDIVDPKVVIPMGKEAYYCVFSAFGAPRARSLLQALDESPSELPGSKLLFPVFHCGGLGLANRPLSRQLDDWRRIARYVQTDP
jgi:uracil-DNA glycosylase